MPVDLPPPPAESPARYQCRVIQTPQQWAPLRSCWDALLHASPDATPWQSFDFLTQWWQHKSNGNRLRILIVERDGDPCLILPLQISTWPWLRGCPVYMLEPIGMIMDVNRPRFALGRADTEAYDCALAEIWRRRDEWHLIRLDEKTEDDAEVRRLHDFATAHDLMFRQRFSHLCPYLDLHQTWEGYLQRRGNRLRKNLRASRRRLEELGPVTLRIFEDADEILAGFDVVLALHQRSWKLKKKIEHSESVAYQAFYRAWLESQARLGRTRILALYCDRRPVAATIAFMDDSTYYSAQIVHDAEFARCSPGTLLEALELEGLMQEQRFSTYDFLGSFLNNKMRWTDTAIRTTHVFVMRRCIRNLLIDSYYFQLKPFIKPRLLKLRERVRGKT